MSNVGVHSLSNPDDTSKKNSLSYGFTRPPSRLSSAWGTNADINNPNPFLGYLGDPLYTSQLPDKESTQYNIQTPKLLSGPISSFSSRNFGEFGIKGSNNSASIPLNSSTIPFNMKPERNIRFQISNPPIHEPFSTEMERNFDPDGIDPFVDDGRITPNVVQNQMQRNNLSFFKENLMTTQPNRFEECPLSHVGLSGKFCSGLFYCVHFYYCLATVTECGVKLG